MSHQIQQAKRDCAELLGHGQFPKQSCLKIVVKANPGNATYHVGILLLRIVSYGETGAAKVGLSQCQPKISAQRVDQ